MKKMEVIVKGKVFKYPGAGGWHFVYVGKKESLALKADTNVRREGFGFIPATARLGGTTWKTSLFPTKEGLYLLSIKASVRKKEGIQDGDTVKVICTIGV